MRSRTLAGLSASLPSRSTSSVVLIAAVPSGPVITHVQFHNNNSIFEAELM